MINRFDFVALKGRGSVLFSKAIKNNTGEYVKYKDFNKRLKDLVKLFVKFEEFCGHDPYYADIKRELSDKIYKSLEAIWEQRLKH